jgi:hypothetical protein
LFSLKGTNTLGWAKILINELKYFTINWIFCKNYFILLAAEFLLNYLLKRHLKAGNTKGGSITVPLTSCLTGLDSAVWQLTIFVFNCKTG